MTATLRGYATCFGHKRFLDNHETDTYLPGCFAKVVESQKPIPILWSSHDGPTIGHTDIVFADDYGLAFAAEIDFEGQSDKLLDIVRGHCSFASLAPINTRCTKQETETGVHYDINEAGVEHIAIVPDPAIKGTRVWRGDPGAQIQHAPFDVQRLDDQWLCSFQDYQADLAANPPLPEEAQPAFQVPDHLSDRMKALLFTPIAMTRESRKRLCGMIGYTPPWMK